MAAKVPESTIDPKAVNYLLKQTDSPAELFMVV